MNQSRQPLLERAADILCEHRSGSASLLQRTLTIGHGDARELISQLASVGFLERPNPLGRYRWRCDVKRGIERTAAERHARLLRDLSLYLLECRGGANSECVKLILDPVKCDFSALKDAVALMNSNAVDPVLTLARNLASLPGLTPPASSEWDETLHATCAGAHPQPHHLEGNVDERRHRSLVRAVRYLEKRMYDSWGTGWGPHSRCLELFVPDELIPQGVGLEGKPTYREHVVPCVLLCAEATFMLQHTIPVEEVAAWIDPFLRIVCIDPAFAATLDGEHRLKLAMPPGWEFGRGCIYERLHVADILFTPPVDVPCVCGCATNRHV